MSEISIKRRTRSVPVSVVTSTGGSTTLRLDDMAGGVISVGTMATAAGTYQCWGAVDEAGPYRRVYGSDGSAADITLAPSSTEGRIYSLPDAVFAVPFVRIVSSTAGATSVAAEVSFKS
jgi:hypothetical protein